MPLHIRSRFQQENQVEINNATWGGGDGAGLPGDSVNIRFKKKKNLHDFQPFQIHIFPAAHPPPHSDVTTKTGRKLWSRKVSRSAFSSPSALPYIKMPELLSWKLVPTAWSVEWDSFPGMLNKTKASVKVQYCVVFTVRWYKALFQWFPSSLSLLHLISTNHNATSHPDLFQSI